MIYEAFPRCSRCGKIFNVSEFKSDNVVFRKMVADGICYNCAYWTTFTLESDMEIIGGCVYRVFPPQTEFIPGAMLGGSGMKYILKKDRTTKKSNDIWKVAEIPQNFRDKFKDTGWWITKMFYYRWTKKQWQCNAKGCLDRYHCFRYNYKIEYENGAYNIVPKSWILGRENCGEFLNLLDISRYDELYDINDLLQPGQF